MYILENMKHRTIPLWFSVTSQRHLCLKSVKVKGCVQNMNFTLQDGEEQH